MPSEILLNDSHLGVVFNNALFWFYHFSFYFSCFSQGQNLARGGVVTQTIQQKISPQKVIDGNIMLGRYKLQYVI